MIELVMVIDVIYVTRSKWLSTVQLVKGEHLTYLINNPILIDFGCLIRMPCILHHCHSHTWGDACNSYTGHCHQLLFLDILRCWVGENMPFVCLITCFCFSNIVSYLSKKIILFFSFSSGIYIFLLSDQSLEAWDYPFN